MKNILRKIFVLILFQAYFCVGFSKTAYAYFDPGTGSFILQVTLAGFFAAIFAFKNFWIKAWSLIKKRIFPKKDS